MFKRSKVSTGVLLALSALTAGSVMAQNQRVEITGSAIKRIDAETSVPVTIVKIDDLKAQGVTSVEQIMASLSAVQMTQGSSQQVGSGTGGASFADLRGIGPSKTLVLLNGRRIANNAIDGSAPDLNMIPFAALERVEVLRDGASSLYGTDAIGGVINFITRKDFQGGSITLGVDVPAEKGGKGRNANIGFGFGDLAGKGFNVFGFIDMAKTDPIAGNERPFNARFPGGISPTTFPGNYFQGGAVGNPAAPACPASDFLVALPDGTSCNYATANFVDYTAKTERVSGMLRGTLRVAQDHNLSAEWFYTRNESTTRIAPVPYGGLWMNPRKPDGTLNPFYPGNPGAITPNIALDPNFIRDTNLDGIPDMTPRPGVTLQPGFINVRWRTLDGGSRSNTSLNEQQRFLAGLDGVIAGWDYQAGFSYNENKIKETVAGYSDGNKITQGVLNGILNPFGAQDAAGEAFFQDALLGGNLQNHRGKVTTLDTRFSRELGDWLGSGRNVAVAFGGEYRKEDFRSAATRCPKARATSPRSTAN
jgi:iron complex outermembrane recepter protein